MDQISYLRQLYGKSSCSTRFEELRRNVSYYATLTKFRVSAIWTGVVSLVILTVSVLSFFFYPIGSSCDHPNVSWHWLTIVWIDTI
jgi:hypothetical protein